MADCGNVCWGEGVWNACCLNNEWSYLSDCHDSFKAEMWFRSDWVKVRLWLGIRSEDNWKEKKVCLVNVLCWSWGGGLNLLQEEC